MVTGNLWLDANWRASVVLPHCLGPNMAIRKLSLNRPFNKFISGVLCISILKLYHEISICQVEISYNTLCRPDSSTLIPKNRLVDVKPLNNQCLYDEIYQARTLKRLFGYP